MIPESYKLISSQLEIPGVFTFHTAPASGVRCASFLPGQFSMLYLPGIGEVPISISGDLQLRSQLTYTVRSVGAVSKKLTELTSGDWLGVRGPFGNGWPIDAAHGRDLLLIAGGLGLAPLRPAIYFALHQRQLFNRITLLYGCRTPQDRLFEQEYDDWQNRANITFHQTVDIAPSGYRGNVDLVTRLIAPALRELADPVVFLCGPEIMMRYSAQELLQNGASSDNIFLSLERNMKCAVGVCGRCQFGPSFLCKDGPVLCYRNIQHLLQIREL